MIRDYPSDFDYYAQVAADDLRPAPERTRACACGAIADCLMNGTWRCRPCHAQQLADDISASLERESDRELAWLRKEGYLP